VSIVNPGGASELPSPTADEDGDERSKGKRAFNRAFEHRVRIANRLIEKGQYEAGVVALRALRRDTHPDVAAALGYASHRLGNYDDAKYWYEEALTADPTHARAWSNYGIWHAEQGNLVKARDYLDKIVAISGNPSPEYRDLEGVIKRLTIS
jgi:Flp pilus assembly protein TadD